MPSLREKMKQEMILVGYSQSTQAIYLNAVIRLRDHYKQSPATLTTEQLREYLLYLLQQKKFAPRTYNTQVYALRFFYCVTLRQPLRKLDLPTTKVKESMPPILSIQEVERLIKATSNIKHRALLMVAYSAGLRVSEVVNLQLTDIDSDRMTLHIRDSKNGKDRLVILSPKVLHVLREYWKACHFKTYLFPRRNDITTPLSTASAQKVFKQAKEKAGIKKEGGMHSLRHAAATHLLEGGVDLFRIKMLMGHSRIETTVKYLSYLPDKDQSLSLPIEQFAL